MIYFYEIKALEFSLEACLEDMSCLKERINEIEKKKLLEEEQVNNLKNLLIEEEKLRNNRIEYDSIAQLILEFESRESLNNEIFKIEQIILELENTSKNMENEINLKKKKINLFLNGLFDDFE
jgi:hypothetical protein